jgi:hypothetical protein
MGQSKSGQTAKQRKGNRGRIYSSTHLTRFNFFRLRVGFFHHFQLHCPFCAGLFLLGRAAIYCSLPDRPKLSRPRTLCGEQPFPLCRSPLGVLPQLSLLLYLLVLLLPLLPLPLPSFLQSLCRWLTRFAFCEHTPAGSTLLSCLPYFSPPIERAL